ncbi:hypothetical protein NDI39_06770 [Microcoleus sp. ZQ-A2]|nr:hypothetical protein [Microcoleus sp. FACHB-1]
MTTEPFHLIVVQCNLNEVVSNSTDGIAYGMLRDRSKGAITQTNREKVRSRENALP